MNGNSRRKFLGSMFSLPIVTALDPYSLMSSYTNEHGFKLKLSLNVYSFNRPLRKGTIDLFDVLQFCAKYNFDAIDPTGYYFPNYPEKPDSGFIREFKREAFLLGLDISGTGIRNDFANPDIQMRKKDLDMIRSWISVAANLGAPCLRVFTGKSKYEGYTRDEVFNWMAKDLKTCCDYGRSEGVLIALQNHNEFLKTSDDVNRLLDMVNSEWLGLNLDIGSYRELNPYEEIQKNIHHAITWQIKENVWEEGIQKPSDFVHLFRMIKKSGYRGYLPLETLGEGDPFEKVPRLLENVQTALKNS